MSNARQNLVDRTGYVFPVPSMGTALGAVLVVGVLVGVAALGPTVTGIVVGLAVLGIPAWVATALTGPLDRHRDGTFTADRSAFLALAMSVVVATFVVAAIGVRAVLGGGHTVLVDAVFLASAGTFAFRLLVLVAVSGPPLVDRVLPAAVQPVTTAAVVVVVAIATNRPLVTGDELLITALGTVLYGGIVVGLVVLVDYPLGRDWGISGFEFLHLFLEYIADRSTELESLFESIGDREAVPLSVLVIRDCEGAEKARVVVPLAHPGPLSGVGGGVLPYRLDATAEGLAFTPHGLAGHASDPASRSGVEAICAAATDAAADVDFEPTATPPVRARVDDATVCGQGFGDGSFLVSTFAPATTDDVDRAVGIDVLAAAANGGDPLVTDAHNVRRTDDVNDGRTTPGSDRARALTEAASRASRSIRRASRGHLRVGVAADPTPYGVEDGIGPLGVRVLVTDVDGSTAAYVLVDGNNMVPGLREELRDAVRDAIPDLDLVSVSTTDTHAVNQLRSTNYVGGALDGSELASLVAETASEAVADLEPVEAGTATQTATVTVIGEDPIDEIATFTDRILPVCGTFVLTSSLLVTGLVTVLFWIAHV